MKTHAATRVYVESGITEEVGMSAGEDSRVRVCGDWSFESFSGLGGDVGDAVVEYVP